MKKVLITGASGSVGKQVITYLLSEGKYEITALDLYNKKSIKGLKNYKKRINIVYGDVNDQVLMSALVETHDYIIHLASVMPPLADISDNIARVVDYNGTENIIKAIKKYNSKCFLLYASSTSIYGDTLECTKNSEIDESKLSNYSLNKYNTEKLIKKELKNYCIFRLPLILNSIKKQPFMFHVRSNSVVEVITKEDVAYAFVRAIDYKKELNKKTFNVSVNETINYNELINKILKYYGVSFKYVLSRIFLDKNYYSPVVKDGLELESIIHFQNDSLYNYFNRLKYSGNKRKLEKFLGKIILFIKK